MKTDLQMNRFAISTSYHPDAADICVPEWNNHNFSRAAAIRTITKKFEEKGHDPKTAHWYESAEVTAGVFMVLNAETEEMDPKVLHALELCGSPMIKISNEDIFE